LILFGLYLTRLYSYLLFHSLAEIFSIVVACGIFMVALNARGFLDNNYFLFIGIAYLFVAILDLIHSLTYTGMGVFPGYGTNLPTQLWIAARYMESTSLLVAPLFVDRKVKINFAFAAYAAAFTLVLASIFYWKIFPDCFVEGVGLTSFKKISEYIMSLMLTASIGILISKRKAFDTRVIQMLVASIILTICSELAFTLYVDAYSFSNLMGHFCKIVSFYLIYKAIIQTGLFQPYKVLFRNLKQSEESLRRAHEELEQRVEERTTELRRVSSQLLKVQEDERRRISRELHDSIGQLLAALQFGVNDALGRIPEGPTEASVNILEALIPLIKQASEEVRRIHTDLRPSLLDDLGIIVTISWFCRECERLYSGIRIERRFDIEEKEVPEPLKIVIFRILQEAVNNVAKHSKADLVRVSLKKTGRNMELVIDDNGQGFDVEHVRSMKLSQGSVGLASMRERTELSGGSFSIDSIKGDGTIVRASWQL
jgi:signal transduction histidine kinase